MKIIQEELFENFQQRIQIRRALMELDEQNATNILEMRKKRAEIIDWEKNDSIMEDEAGDKSNKNGERLSNESKKRPFSALPEHIKNNYANIKTLRTSTYQNIATRNQLNMQLIENIDEAKKIKDSIGKRIKNQDKREYLELVIKNHVLELQNIELEIQLKIQEKTIGDLKNIVEGQQKLLVENNLDQLVNIPWEEAPDLLNGNSNEDNQDEDPNGKSLRDYEDEDLKIADLVYDDEGELNQDSGSFEMQYDPKKKDDGKRDKVIKVQDKGRNRDKLDPRDKNNQILSSIDKSEESYLERKV